MDNNHDEEQGLIPVLSHRGDVLYNTLSSSKEENRTTSPDIIGIYLAAEQSPFICTSTFERVCLALMGGIIFGGVVGMFAVIAWFAASSYPYWDNIASTTVEH